MLFGGGLVIQTNFLYFCSHPGHYPKNGLRLLEEGDRVEGSSGFPGPVCLHPLHDPPPVCTASSLWSSFPRPPLIQRHRVCGARGDRHRVCSYHHHQCCCRWCCCDTGCPPRPRPLSVGGFNLTSKFPAVLSRLTGQRKLCATVLTMLCRSQRRSRWRTRERAPVVTPRTKHHNTQRARARVHPGRACARSIATRSHALCYVRVLCFFPQYRLNRREKLDVSTRQ